MRLYEINEQLRALVGALSDDITEEVDIDAAFEQIEALELARDEKLVGIYRLIREQEAYSKALAEESDKLSRKSKAAKHKASNLLNYVKRFGLDEGENFEAAGATFKWKQTPPAVSVIDEGAIPLELWREQVTRSIDKIAARKRLKAGEEIPGLILKSERRLYAL